MMSTQTQAKTKDAGKRIPLSMIQHKPVLKPARVMLYGVDGIGKSTFAASRPAPIFIPTEDGATRLDVPQFPLCTSWEDIFACLRSLAMEDHEFKTCVLDSADWAQALAVKHIMGTIYDDDTEKFNAYGRGWVPVMDEWRRLLDACNVIRDRKGMEIFFIAHAVASTVRNPDGSDYQVWQSNLHSSQNTSIWALTKEWTDLMLFANYKIIVKDAEQNKAGKAIMAKGDNQRMVYAAPSATYSAKVRAGWELPAEFPLSAEVFAEYVTNPTIKTDTQDTQDTKEITHEG